MTQGNISPIQAAPDPVDPGVRIGHVHLRTADIDRVLAGGYHHHLGFNTWKSAGGAPQPDGVAGLHHVALNYPTRAGLELVWDRPIDQWPQSEAGSLAPIFDDLDLEDLLSEPELHAR